MELIVADQTKVSRGNILDSPLELIDFLVGIRTKG